MAAYPSSLFRLLATQSVCEYDVGRTVVVTRTSELDARAIDSEVHAGMSIGDCI